MNQYLPLFFAIMKRSYSVILAILFYFCSTALYARAGGASGGGGNAGRGIGLVVALLNIGLIAYYVWKKNKKAKTLIDQSHQNDLLWDYDQMISLAKEVFERMQNAWMERDMDLVRDIVSDNLYQAYQKKLNWMKVTRSQNIIKNIRFKKIKIVGDEDHEDNSQDRFTVFFKGTMVDYLISDKTGKIYDNSRKKKSIFYDLYYFVRIDNKWVLDNIENKATLGKIVKNKQMIE